MSQDSNKIAEQVGRVHVGELGSYRILESIGAGGMGSVALGEVVESERRVALKFLHEELAEEGSSSRDRFEREIRVLQDLKAFRGIVQIEDWGRTDDGILFLVMEYVSAPTLDKVIEQNPQGLTQIRAVQIVTEILSVLEPIHHRKFIHRDLKPHNICVYEEPLAIRLLDFGLSKPFTEGLGYDKVTRRMQGKGNEIPGSPHYMAVEQFLRPKDVDERTDLYAVGIILYELLAGIPPYRGIYLQDILKQHKENEPPPIDNCADGGPISYRLQAVVDKSLAKSPESRYQSAAEFKEALFDVLNMLNKQRRPRKTLDGRYRILRKIGQGGNSEVFEAEQLDDSTRVALKIAREGSSDWDEETLMNEADRALNHDNIVKVHEFGEFEGRPALVMELLEGGTLEDVLKKYEEDGLPENIFYRSMVDICRGLHHAHQSNIVHRDVKPGNMLRTVEGRTKVCDFGIAKRFEQSGDDMEGAKNTTLAKGTAQYISPEQCDMQGRVDRRADVYCLGVMMYEMLAGELPFTEGILIMQHLQMDPPPLKVKGRYNNPDALARVVERAMQKDPAKRFQSMKELAQELVRVSKLQPQEKPHKAIELSTVPDEWKSDPSRGGVAPTTKIPATEQKSGTAKIAIAAAAAVIVIVGAIAVISGKDDPPPVDNGGDGGGETVAVGPTPREQAAEEYRALGQFVVDKDWQGLRDASLEHLLAEEGEEFRGRLLGDLEIAAGDAFKQRLADSDVVRKSLAELDEIARCAERIDPASALVKTVDGFAKEARVLSEAPTPDADGWIAFDDSRSKAVRGALEAIEGPLAGYTSVWERYLDDLGARRFENNAEALVAVIDRTTGLDEAMTGRVAEIAEHAPRGALPAPVLSSLSAWSGRSAKALSDVSKRFAFMTKDAPAALGVDANDVLRAAGRFRSNPGRSVNSAVDALAAGLVSAEADDSVLDALGQAIGVNPSQWADAKARVEALGVPVESFRGVISKSVAKLFSTAELETAVLADAPTDAAAKGPYADRLDGHMAELMGFAQLSGDDREAVEAEWTSATSSLRVGDAAVARSRINAAIDGWRAAPSWELGELVTLFAKMNAHAGNYRADSDAMRTVAAEILDGLAPKGQHLAEVILVNGSTQLVARADREARLNRAKSSFVAALTSSPDIDLGIAGNCNAAWAGTEERCIVLKYLLPSGEGALLESGDVTVASDVGEARIDGNELVIVASPRELDVASMGTGGPLKLEFPLQLSSERFRFSNEPVVLEVKGGADRYDFEMPEVTADFRDRATSEGWRVTVDVRDDSAPAGGFAPVLTINGKSIQRESGDASRTRWLVKLDHLAAGDTVDSVSLVVADALGNEVTIEADETDVDSARRDLVRAAEDGLVEAFRSQEGTFRSGALSSKSVDDVRDWVVRSGAELGSLAKYDPTTAKRLAEDLTRRYVPGIVGGWTSGATTASLEGAKGAVDRLAASLRSVESTFGLGSDESTRLVADYGQRITDSKGPVVADGGGSDSGNDSGGSRDGGSGRSRPTFDVPEKKRPFEDYERGQPSISALGLTLLKVDGGSDGPAWVSTVEVSRGFAERYFPDAVREAEGEARSNHKSLRWKLESGMPLVPLTPDHVEAALAVLRRTAGTSEFASQCGGPVQWDIPTRKQWNGAGELHGGGTYAWGNDAGGVRGYGYRNAGDKRAGWFDGLRDVNADPARGRFEFLSGNAWEIVRSRFQSTKYKRIGGSMVEACDARSLKYLELGSGGRTQSPGTSERFTGFRLALVPTDK